MAEWGAWSGRKKHKQSRSRSRSSEKSHIITNLPPLSLSLSIALCLSVISRTALWSPPLHLRPFHNHLIVEIVVKMHLTPVNRGPLAQKTKKKKVQIVAGCFSKLISSRYVYLSPVCCLPLVVVVGVVFLCNFVLASFHLFWPPLCCAVLCCAIYYSNFLLPIAIL